jgi:hypothetical protein
VKHCNICDQTLPLGMFYRNCRMPDGYLKQCKQCHGDRYRVARAQRAKQSRLYIQQIKLDRGCADCGFNSHPAALDFDHLPEFVKVYRVCTMADMSRELIDAEIAKCEVVCANCHRIRTVTRLKEVDHG